MGKRIVEEEQDGKERADYGSYIIRNLSESLIGEYGSGFGVRQLEQSRQFYLTYPIANTLRSQLNWNRSTMDGPHARLSAKSVLFFMNDY